MSEHGANGTTLTSAIVRVVNTAPRFKWKALIAAACIAFATQAAPQSASYQRALRNYQAVASGQKKLADLSVQEQQEVLEIYRVIRSRGNTDESDDCRESKERAQQAASELADYARRLKNCAESSDLSDDCSSEFRRVRNAQDEYESAVSDVQSNCS